MEAVLAIPQEPTENSESRAITVIASELKRARARLVRAENAVVDVTKEITRLKAELKESVEHL